MNKKYVTRFAVAFSSLVIYGGVLLLIPDLVGEFPFLVRFLWQYYALLGFAAILSIIGMFGEYGFSRFTLYLRIGIACLIGFTIAGNPLIPALLLLGIFLDAGFRQKTAWVVGIILTATTVLLVVILPEQLVFGVPVPGMDRDELLVFLVIIFPVAALSTGLSVMTNREMRWRLSIDRLDLAVSKLAEANLGYQGYAQDIRLRSIAEERRRISREIHDSVGYSLTNIRVMLEAASLQMPTKPEETDKLIHQSMDEASLCLEQTRKVMRLLRAREDPPVTGLSAIQRLITAFAEVSGINVVAEYGNAPVRWPIAIEKAVYRLIQEGMTNAFRHGMATEIVIYMRQDQDMFQIIVRDNGSGTGEVKEGIGIAGMRERVTALGGNLQVGPHPDGFEVKARIPISDKEGANADQNTSG